MFATMLLLAQLAGGGTVALDPGLPPPTCGPALPNGTVCVWRGYPVQIPSQQHPEKSILVSIMSTDPTPTPGTSGNLFIRRVVFRVLLEYSDTCVAADTYEYNLEAGVSCPLPGPPE